MPRKKLKRSRCESPTHHYGDDAPYAVVDYGGRQITVCKHCYSGDWSGETRRLR